MNTEYRNSLFAISPSLTLWIPKVSVHPAAMRLGGSHSNPRSQTKRSLKRLAEVILRRPGEGLQSPVVERDHDVVFTRNRGTTAHRSFEDSQGGVDAKTQYTLDCVAMDAWRDQQSNPDDYEPESSTCEDCGQVVAFYLTGSGTITEWCPECGIISEGANFQPVVRRPTSGAFGERTLYTRRRRFWSLGSVPRRPRTYWPKTGPAYREFLPPAVISEALGATALNPSYANRVSAYAPIIEAACAGKPIVVPTPEGVSQKVFENRLRAILHMNKRTAMARWSVSRLDDGGLRVGVVGSWLIK